jgi:hypothetical protein
VTTSFERVLTLQLTRRASNASKVSFAPTRDKKNATRAGGGAVPSRSCASMATRRSGHETRTTIAPRMIESSAARRSLRTMCSPGRELQRAPPHSAAHRCTRMRETSIQKTDELGRSFFGAAGPGLPEADLRRRASGTRDGTSPRRSQRQRVACIAPSACVLIHTAPAAPVGSVVRSHVPATSLTSTIVLTAPSNGRKQAPTVNGAPWLGTCASTCTVCPSVQPMMNAAVAAPRLHAMRIAPTLFLWRINVRSKTGAMRHWCGTWSEAALDKDWRTMQTDNSHRDPLVRIGAVRGDIASAPNCERVSRPQH